MPFCMNCGNKVPDGAKFCASCGSEVGIVKKEESQRKMTYDGEIHKCPNCGEILKSFMSNCPSCGYELRTINTSNSPVNELAKRIESARTLEMKLELITNFYVPNTKEDIYEFFILAVSNLEDTNYDTDDAWLAKLEQTYHKAKLLFGDTPEFEYVDELYKKTIAKVSKRGTMNFFRKNKNLIMSVILVSIGIIMMIVGIKLMCTPSDTSTMSGMMLLMFGMLFLAGPVWVSSAEEEIESKKNGPIIVETKNSKKSGKETMYTMRKNYMDIAEQFKSMDTKKK